MKTVTKFIYPTFAVLAVVFFALSPTAQGVLPSPTPDGGYPGANTAEGTDALFSLTSGIANTAVGQNALHDNTTGGWNVAIGSGALASNTTGNFNMAIGTDALTNNTSNFNLAIGFRVLFMNTSGNHLTGIGAAALRNNTTANFNTAIGADALRENTTGEDNTAIGADALAQNTIGEQNTAIGRYALFSNNGNLNTAIGVNALASNTEGYENTAIGDQALLSNRSGIYNAAIGAGSLRSNTTGVSDTATGTFALVYNTFGNFNTANGTQALENNTTGDANTAIGAHALKNNTTGHDNIAVGYRAGAEKGVGASNNIYIGDHGFAEDVNTIGIGIPGIHTDSTFIQGIFGATVPGGSAVLVDSAGHLGTIPSSARFKQNIRDMADASHAILGLRPVTFRYKPELDPNGTPQFGLVAEEVEKINPALVVRDAEGKVYTVRYEAVNAMLLNEFLKEHRKVEVQEKTIAGLKSGMAALAATVKEQASQIQKVSAQVEASKFATGRIRRGEPAPQVVNNP